MPELKKVDVSNFEESPDIPDIDSIKYRDKSRERQRQDKLKPSTIQNSADGKHQHFHKTGPRREQDRGKTKTKNVLKRDKDQRPQLNKSERKKQKQQDLMDIDKEYRLLKKLKRVSLLKIRAI